MDLIPTQKSNPNPKRNPNLKRRSNSPFRKLQLDLTPFQKRSPNPSWIPQALSSFHLLSLPTISSSCHINDLRLRKHNKSQPLIHFFTCQSPWFLFFFIIQIHHQSQRQRGRIFHFDLIFVSQLILKKKEISRFPLLARLLTMTTGTSAIAATIAVTNQQLCR